MRKGPMGLKWAFGLPLAAIAVAAPAIIIRDDAEDARYRALGERYRLSVVDMAVPGRADTPIPGRGAGTLIAPQWVLTAAHVGLDLIPGGRNKGVTRPPSVFFEGEAYPIEAVHAYPGATGEEREIDVALVKLAKPVRGGKPVCLYPARDEVGKVTTLIGRGSFGDGRTGPGRGTMGVLRGATVRIGGIADDGRTLFWPFRAPGDPKATPLEGISGPGDSGGPALLTYKGRLCVAGVSSTQDSRGLGEGRYTVVEYYPRVSRLRPWIESVMKRDRRR